MTDANKGEIFSINLRIHEACADDDHVIGQLVRKKIEEARMHEAVVASQVFRFDAERGIVAE